MWEHVATARAGGRIPLFLFLSELTRGAAFRAQMQWCLCAIHRGAFRPVSSWTNKYASFSTTKSLVVIIRPFLIKQEAIFSANCLYFPCIERSAFRFCQSCIPQPEQPGNNHSQKRYSRSPFAALWTSRQTWTSVLTKEESTDFLPLLLPLPPSLPSNGNALHDIELVRGKSDPNPYKVRIGTKIEQKRILSPYK